MCYNEYTEAQGLVEVDLSAISDLFGSSQFMSCPRAVLFFERLYPASSPPISVSLDSISLPIDSYQQVTNLPAVTGLESRRAGTPTQAAWLQADRFALSLCPWKT